MRVVRTREDVVRFRESIAGEGRRLALVPTMGYLHDGHLSLMREGGKRADVVATTIFVNPTQFAPNEDLSRYPRDEAGDVKKCESAGATLVWAPEPNEVYPDGYQTYVEVREASKGLDGDRRPGHFRGVATVVTKLLALFRPSVALFGEKDFQQLKVIEGLNRDLELGVEIVGMPIIREPDGLVMSSRNAYLQGAERQRALALSKGLFSAQATAKAGERDVKVLLELMRAEMTKAEVRIDYAEIVDAKTLKSLERLDGRPARALVAGFVGATRLIDNVAIP
jgi:pantoate--beta-alanine ligase